MAKGIHKGTELNNVKETWEQNERNRDSAGDTAPVNNDLEQVIHEEAAEYDRANKEERLLDGERATVNDDRKGDE